MEIEIAISLKIAKLERSRTALDELEHEVRTLEREIDTLQEAQSILNSVNDQDEFDVVLSKQELAAMESPLPISPRNPRGSVQKALMTVFEGGDELELDEILSKLNQQVQNPLTIGNLRTTLMNLKTDGILASRKPGVYRLVEKEEAPEIGGFDDDSF
ncbi:MAG: hypothetical protein FWD77_02635 [Betaproteobacteria bacterium]|nr:hypothetical protein [Betaproteobacteria bacterium]